MVAIYQRERNVKELYREGGEGNVQRETSKIQNADWVLGEGSTDESSKHPPGGSGSDLKTGGAVVYKQQRQPHPTNRHVRGNVGGKKSRARAGRRKWSPTKERPEPELARSDGCFNMMEAQTSEVLAFGDDVGWEVANISKMKRSDRWTTRLREDGRANHLIQQ
ncbi:hypothetical protein GALMADRAFT_211995 [Galerina marginata CBS 339.88]|uniref:Uncharacterized protein n=1 Tax=Galerina marginata (strain CBS 339.88) TaxID=685588 RepID=A0A067T644_GALM3|nr:hypothetical protein GALMADRAFT_211995 [Galerina marginata CBS 339.88]